MDCLSVDRDQPCAVLTIERPEARNAISRAVIAAFAGVLDQLEKDPPQALIVTGRGDRAFIAGGDVRDFDAIRDLSEARAMAWSMRRVLDRVRALPCPTVAALNGDAYGGGMEVAVSCDFRLARDDAVLAFNQISLGITPAWGGIERVAQLVGPGKAAHLLMTGERLSAAKGERIGLVEASVPPAEFPGALAAMRAQLGAASGPALRAIKRAIDSAGRAVEPAAASAAVEDFAQCWVDEAHWQAIEQMQDRRAAAKS
jgi:enoyl-CoA hydratase/carnithine racemase